MGGVVSAGVDNDELVDKLKGADYIKSPNVEKVFRLVDRGYYLTKDNQNVAYRDNAWRSGNLHISAPCIYAQVMEGLQLGPGMSFLNLGSGTGYLSTMAGLLIGPNGINHGVELHSDVISYARDRLAWFECNTGAIDVMPFCEPEFVQGNALCLGEDTTIYDRVYCGASCPSSHENYMKNLLKVGGILVMPRNDQLLKIVRTTKDTWSSDSLLPVSFSSLVMPDQTYPPENVDLPAITVPSLQEKSREVICSKLRSGIEVENKELVNAFVHPVPTDPEPRIGQRYYCRVRRTFHGMPFSDPEDDSEPSDGQEEERNILYDAQRSTANQITAFLEFARTIELNGGNFSGEDLISALEEGRTTEEEPQNRPPENTEEEPQNRPPEDTDEEAPNRPPEDAEEELQNRSTENIEIEPEVLGDVEMHDVEVEGEKDSCEVEINEDPVNTSEMTNSEVPQNLSFSLQESELVSDQEVHTVLPNESRLENDMECSGTSDSNPEMAGSSSSSNNSLPIPNRKPKKEKTFSTSASLNGRRYAKVKSNSKREPKKREKFDSGIGEEDRESRVRFEDEDSTTSSSTPSTSYSPYSFLSYSDNEYSEGCDGGDDVPVSEIPRCNKKRTGKCVCKNCDPNSEMKKKWKKQERKRRKERKTLKYKKEMRDDSQNPIKKYSTLTIEKINQLPLPTPLKMYVHFNRPL